VPFCISHLHDPADMWTGVRSEVETYQRSRHRDSGSGQLTENDGDVRRRNVACLTSRSRPVISALTRISHGVEAHRGANQRKFFCEKDFAMIRGTPRCRQSVAQSGLILEG
jgi:hypothetical protein